MDHSRIEEQNVAESYVLGQLSPDEVDAFETHLLGCRECRERVAWVEDMRDSFQGFAAEEANRAVEAGLLAWLVRRGTWARAGLGIGLLLLAAAPSLWLLADRERLLSELAAVRTAEPPRPGETTLPPAEAARQAKLAAERDRLAARQAQLEGELAEARRGREELSRQVAGLSRPQANTVLFTLGLVRGGAETNRLLLPLEPGWIVLSCELPDPTVDAYRARLVDPRGQDLWQGELRRNASDTLTLAIHSSQLAPGSYRLVFQGLPAGPSEIAFRVESSR